MKLVVLATTLLLGLPALAQVTTSNCKVLPTKQIVIHSKPRWKANPTTELPPSPSYNTQCATSEYSVYPKHK